MTDPLKTYDYIAAYHAKNGYPPTQRIIAAELGLCIQTAHNHIDYLEDSGWIEVQRGPSGYRRWNTLRLLGRPVDG
jgi:DNA-binding MarR family transcriptional regulator